MVEALGAPLAAALASGTYTTAIWIVCVIVQWYHIRLLREHLRVYEREFKDIQETLNK